MAPGDDVALAVTDPRIGMIPSSVPYGFLHRHPAQRLAFRASQARCQLLDWEVLAQPLRQAVGEQQLLRSFREVFRKMSRDAIAGPVLEAMQAAAVVRRKKAT